jgi:hypothetical protein
MDEEERKRRFHRKLNLSNDNRVEYYTHLLNKHKHHQDEVQDRVNIKGRVTLEIGHEKRLEEMKEYFMKLNEKVDNNMHKYEQYAGNGKSRIVSPIGYQSMEINHSANYNKPNSPGYYNTTSDNKQPTNYYHNNAMSSPTSNNKQYFHPESNPIKSDVTSNYIFDKLTNGDYKHYKDINQNYHGYNRDIIETHEKKKADDFHNKRFESMERVKDLDRYNQANLQAKNFKNEQQNLYRYILDNQVHGKDSNINLHKSYNNNIIPKSPCMINF